MKRTITSLLAMFVCAFTFAQHTSLTVDNQTPGWLSSKIKFGDQETVENLKVTGYMNATDFDFLMDLNYNRKLQGVIDLSEVNIIKGGNVTTCSIERDNMLGDYIFGYRKRLRKLITPESADSMSISCFYYMGGTGYGTSIIDTVIINGKMQVVNSDRDGILYLKLPETAQVFWPEYYHNSHYVGKNNYKKKTLVLPPKIRYIYHNGDVRISRIICYVTNPQQIQSRFLGSVNARVICDTLYIPKGCTNPTAIQASVVIQMIDVEKVTLNTHRTSVHVGDENITLSTSLSPSDAMNKPLTWYSTDEEVAIVDSGKIAGKKFGSAKIIVETYNGKRDTCDVHVYEHTTGVRFADGNPQTIYVGDNVQLKAETLPLGTSDNAISWSSSDPQIATIDAITGRLTALQQGTCIIKATSTDGNYVSSQTMGFLQHVTNVRLNTHSHNMNTGEEFQLQCAVTPANADNKDVIWSSSNDEIASVDQSGKVKALKRGQVKIVATSKDDNSISDVCELTITQLATAIELDKHEARLAIGNTIALNVKVSPQDVNNDKVTWKSSDNGVARVSDDGIVTAVGKGTAKITATTSDGSYLSDVCEIIVWQPVTSVSLEKHECSMKVGETTTLRTSISPNEADNKNLVWTSSNESVATVENGVVTAHASGKARVSVTTADGSELSDDCEITVFQPVIGVNVEPRTLTLKSVGATKQLTADVLPENADNRNVKWSSANTSVCLVMDNGMVVAVGEGSSVVTATTFDGGFTDFCVVNVEFPKDDKRPVTGIKLEQNSVTLSKIGETVKLKATVLPADADNPNIQWDSSDRTVCLVMNDGTVVAIGDGSSIITATTEDGGFSAQCVVVVKSAPSAITETSRDVIVVKAEKHYICVEGMSKDDKLQIFSADGTNVYSGKVSRVHVGAGVYLVKIGNEIVKVIVK